MLPSQQNHGAFKETGNTPWRRRVGKCSAMACLRGRVHGAIRPVIGLDRQHLRGIVHDSHQVVTGQQANMTAGMTQCRQCTATRQS